MTNEELASIYGQTGEYVYDAIGIYNPELSYVGMDPNYPGWYFMVNDDNDRELYPLSEIPEYSNHPKTKFQSVPFYAKPPEKGEAQQTVEITLPFVTNDILYQIEKLKDGFEIWYFIFVDGSTKPHMFYNELMVKNITVSKMTMTIQANRVNLYSNNLFTQKFDRRFEGLWIR